MQIFELFDFYKSEINGSLKNKLSINAFFQKSVVVLHQVFTQEFVQRATAYPSEHEGGPTP